MFSKLCVFGVLAILARPAMGTALNLTDFITCVSSSGSGSTCQLASGVWDVTATIEIQRGVEIVGTVNDASDVVLRRTSTLGANDLMAWDGAYDPAAIVVHWLTFDGNRPNTTACYSGGGAPFAELDLSIVGLATVQNVNFIRGMSDDLRLGASLQNYSTGTASSVSYSQFGQGLVNSGNGYSLNGPQTAAAWNGAILFDDYTGAWYNNIAYSGTAAIAVWNGTITYVINNTLYSNRYEEPDGISGGQLYVNDDATYASAANNQIDGASWNPSNAQQSNPSSANYTLCSPGYAHTGGLVDDHSFGIEAFGLGHRYYNNQVQNNRGYGMLLRDSSTGTHHSMDNTIVSGYDPFCAVNLPPGCTFTPHYLYNNAQCGTGCYNSTHGGFPASMNVANLVINGDNATSANNITLDHIRSENSTLWGANLSNLTGSPGFTDSQNGGTNYACMSSNLGGDLTTNGTIASGYMSFTYSCP
jgi:hypothetical protein